MLLFKKQGKMAESGLRRTTGNRVRINSPPRVRIPLFPPNTIIFGAFGSNSEASFFLKLLTNC